MRRLHLLEIEDQPWCPAPIRDGGTDWLQFMGNTHRAFDRVAPKLRACMNRVGSHRIVDLCSGGGGPWQTLGDTLAASGPLEVQLTDRFPNRTAWQRLIQAAPGRFDGYDRPVDATDVPADLQGVRTLFNAFHHFRPQQARAILADAVAKNQPIAVFEGSDHRLLGILLILVMPLMMLLMTPLIRPWRWSRLVFTYLIPAIPALGLFDGTVSMLRIYSPRELRELVAGVPGRENFDWDIGTLRIAGAPLGLTYLIGLPKAGKG